MQANSLKQLSHNYPFLPVSYQSIVKDFDPFAIIDYFDPKGKQSFMFKQQSQHFQSENTILVIHPEKIYTGLDSKIKIENADGNVQIQKQNPISFLNQITKQYRYPKRSELPPFSAGLCGYFSYEFAKYVKSNRIKPTNNPLELVDFDLFQPDVSINFNHRTKQLTLTKLIPSEHFNRDYSKTTERLININEKIKQLPKANFQPFSIQEPFRTRFNFNKFQERFNETKKNIHLGNIFQMILSNPYIAKSSGPLIEKGRELYQKVNSPYHFYFQHDDFSTIGASPETLIKKSGQKLFSYPLAGTRRRGKNKSEDQKFANELKTDPKELAEHNMLVDLGRNDLGKISQIGSVKVSQLRKLLKFNTVMHLGSSIESRLKKDYSPIDVISNTLPAGTLSGAPKISAMRIINELERRKRGIYGGGIGYIDFNGDLDLCIGIRLAYQKSNQSVIHSGAGIVADSQVDHEFLEFENKSQLMMQILNPAYDQVTEKGEH